MADGQIVARERPSANATSMALWAAIFVGLPASIAALNDPLPQRHGNQPVLPAHQQGQRPTSPPPAVEPVEVLQIAPETARTINAAIPFSTAPNPAARPFRFDGKGDAFERAVDCLASAQLYEAGDDSGGQKAVAQVVLNRLRHPAFPKTVCGVVFQGSERTAGCQFTFTCDGALARIPSPIAWDRARDLARQMLSGKVDPRVGYATHYHTDWVVPYWSGSLDKITSVGTHLFFRWKGWWGTPPAFRGWKAEYEPAIAKLAFLSSVHRGNDGASPAPLPTSAPDLADLAKPALAIGHDRIGDRFGPGRLAAINSGGDAFAMLLERTADPAAYAQLARQMCAGRARCRVLGWTQANTVPSGFPVDDETLRTMNYAYIRIADVGLERSLYNCREFPSQPKASCMRERTPAAAPPAAATPPRTGTEIIRLPSPGVSAAQQATPAG